MHREERYALDFHHKCHLARIESFGFFRSERKSRRSPSHTREQFRRSRKCFCFFFRSRRKHTRFSIVYRNVDFVRVISKHSTIFGPDTEMRRRFLLQFSLSTRPLLCSSQRRWRERRFSARKRMCTQLFDSRTD
jgi:uncharacterized protein YcgL (UPF0745 family)